MAQEPDYYAILGVSPESEDIVIQAAYRALMRRYHPDKNPSVEAKRKTIEINAAYAVLGDASARVAYDATRCSQETKNQSTSSTGSTTPPPPPPPEASWSSKSAPAPSEKIEKRARRQSGGIIFASILGILIVVSVALGQSGQPNDSSLNTMGVDENLTTVDMNASDMNATDMNATDMNATDMNATDMNSTMPTGAPPDLSKQSQTAVSYDTIEAAATRVAKIITTKGISGARAYSEGCHKSVQATPTWDAADSCAAFDYAAAYIDGAVTTQAGWKKNGYFAFQSGSQPDDYAAVGAPSYITRDRLTKIRMAAQEAAADAFRSEVARMRVDQPSQPAPATEPVTENSSE